MLGVSVDTPSGMDGTGPDDGAQRRQTFDALHAELAAVELRLDRRIAGLVSLHDEGLASIRAELAEMRASLGATNANYSVSERGVSAEVELIESWERESSARLSALESRVSAEVHRLSLAVEAQAERVAAADFEGLRRELMDKVTAALGGMQGGVAPADYSQLRADLEFQMVEQLRLLMQEALQLVEARVTVIGAELNGRFEGLVSVEAFVAMRSELREALSRNMESARAALQQRAALLDAAVADLKTQMAHRLDEMATLVATEAAAAAQRATLAALQRRFPTP